MVRNKWYVSISEAQGEKQNSDIFQKHFIVFFLIKGNFFKLKVCQRNLQIHCLWKKNQTKH